VQYRALGRTGLQVSALGLGCMVFGWKSSEGEAARIVAAARAEGVNLVDTSSSYGRGRSEEVLGGILGADRSRVVLCTKFHFRSNDDDINAFGNSRRHIIAECEASLRRLRTDYIDLYQVHQPQPSVPIDETLRALDDLVRSGKVRYIGTSSFPAWRIVESLWASKEYGLNRFVAEQGPYNLLDRHIEHELLPAARSYSIGVLAFSPLAEGILTGKYRKGEALPPNSRFQAVTKPGPYAARLTPAVHAVVDGLRDLAHKKNISVSQLALAWALSEPAISSVLAGPSTAEQLKDNLAALTVSLDQDDLAIINRLAPFGSEISSYRVGDHSASLHHW
jgi:aryl-alcohol dehydrogenase-like predicted oxidoreductase